MDQDHLSEERTLYYLDIVMQSNLQPMGVKTLRDTNMHVFNLLEVKELKITNAVSLATKGLLKNRIDGFWIHLDADVLDDAIMPAVDYRLEDGLSFSDLTEVLKALLATKHAVGMTITILNPRPQYRWFNCK